MSGLSAKQRKFADEYLLDLNASAAYKRAGYKGVGNSAASCASRMLTHAGVAAYIRERQMALQEKTEITQERVILEYARIAFLDPRKFFDAQGGLIPITELDAGTAAALAGMDVSMARDGKDEDGKPAYVAVHKIKMVDKKGALDSLARTLGMFRDQITVKSDPLSELLKTLNGTSLPVVP